MPTSADPIKFYYGYNWVEALTGYIEAATQDADPMTVWKCQAASNVQFPLGATKTALAIYAMNYNMVAQPEGIVKGASTLMLARAQDRLVKAVLSPTNQTIRTATSAPISPFLSTTDIKDLSGTMPGAINTKPHGAGSMILFCDGHVRLFPNKFMPDTLTSATSWDANLSRFNYSTLGNELDE